MGTDDGPDEVQLDNEEVDTALAFFGLQADKPVVPPLPLFFLWPENAPAFVLFHARLRTQWRYGPRGAMGLDYAEVRRCVEDFSPRGARRAARERRDELMEQLLAIEAGCVAGMEERRTEMEQQRDAAMHARTSGARRV